MRRLSGFSLMEMMIVLLIVSIIAAASAPMINRKMVQSAGDTSPWVWTGNNNSIAFNVKPDTRSAMIGTVSVPNNANNSRLYLETNNVSVPQIAFGHSGDGNPIKMIAGRNHNIWISDNINGYSSASSSVVVGTESEAGTESIAIGANAKATDHNSVAIGDNVNNADAFTTVVGSGASAGNQAAAAFGRLANADGENSLAVGFNAQSSGTEGTAVGTNSTASGENSVAYGKNSQASNTCSIAIGPFASSSCVLGIAIGYNAVATNTASAIGIGTGSAARGVDSVALGGQSNASGANAVAIGHNSTANETDSLAIGSAAIASNVQATAIGAGAVASGANSTALGLATTASGANSASLGYLASTPGANSVALGYLTSASTSNTTALGSFASASGLNSTALGARSTASGTNSTAIGYGTTVNSANTIVIGRTTDTVSIPGTVQFGTLRVTNLIVDDTAVFRGKSYFNVYNQSTAPFLRAYYMSDGDKFKTDAWFSSVTVNGTSYSSTWHRSDRRLKNIGKAFTGGLDQIRKLEVFNYTFKDDKDKTPRVGVIAQDLQKVFPNAVIKGEDGFLRIRIEDMFYAVINAIKENDKRITELEKQNKELIKRIEALEKK